MNNNDPIATEATPTENLRMENFKPFSKLYLRNIISTSL